MMIPRSLYALVVFGSAASAAMAGPQVLSLREMDAISAGANPIAAINTLAGATGDFAFANTAGTTLVAANNSLGNNPTTTAYVAVSAGVASATGVGNGAGTTTNVAPTASVPGTNVITYTINQHVQNGGTEVTIGAVAKVGTFFNPLQVIP